MFILKIVFLFVVD